MSIFKNKRVDIIGFNDFWFVVVGILVLSQITDFLFNGGSFFRYSFLEAMVNWGLSAVFATFNWLIMREVMISLRRRFPEFKDNFKRIAIFFFFVVVTIVFVDRLGSFVLGRIFGESYNHPSSSQLLIPILLISVMTLAIYEAIYYYSRLKKFVQEEEQAKQVVVEAQLDALRNQARPHFLFNSLNTLRDIIENDPKDEAIQFVDKLSDVYRYILESGNVNLISLGEELKFAQAYLHVQSERFGVNLKINWDVQDDKLNAMIIPMSLQLLLENAIKHNVVSKAKPLYINVKTEMDKLIVENNLQLKSTQLASTKIGLDSIEKRYALISGSPLIVENDGSKFIVTIPLLESHVQKK